MSIIDKLFKKDKIVKIIDKNGEEKIEVKRRFSKFRIITFILCILILSSFSSDTVTVGNETFNRRESVNINIDTIILNSTLNTINYNKTKL